LATYLFGANCVSYPSYGQSRNCNNYVGNIGGVPGNGFRAIMGARFRLNGNGTIDVTPRMGVRVFAAAADIAVGVLVVVKGLVVEPSTLVIRDIIRPLGNMYISNRR
jgi:hypothetical protein